jgi:YspA, cpYpsA-related SLOG family
MITAVVGTRTFQDADALARVLDTLDPPVTRVVSGGAAGADTLAEAWARKHAVPCTVLKPDWSKGRQAGHLRNYDIVQASDRVVAFWDGVSKGTASTIAMARRAGKLLMVIKV